MGGGNSTSRKNILESVERSKPWKTEKYKTSKYGWGKLKHPIKPDDPSKNAKKMKRKWVDPTAEMTKRVQQNGDNSQPTIKTPESSVVVERSIPIIIERNTSYSSPGASESSPSRNTPKIVASSRINAPINGGGRRNEANGGAFSPVKPSFPPFSTSVLEIQGSRTHGQCFYGQYRCPNSKCHRYWRSGIAKQSVAQNCSRCGTPTFPKP